MDLAALAPFRPRFPWITADLQTVRNYLLKPAVDLSAWRWHALALAMRDGSGDCLHASYAVPCEGRPDGARTTVVLVHGLAGCEDSTYMAAATRAVLEAGHAVLRLNLRGAGPSRALCASQYHAGRSQDLADAFAGLPAALVGEGLAVIGFSLGGNVLAKYLAEQGAGGPVRAAVMISSPLDLASALASMTRRRNRVYHNYLLSRLQIQSTLPDSRCDAETRAVMARARSIFDIDQGLIAPRNGFADAWDYYARCSAVRFLPAVRVPTLAIHALDDPWIPGADYQGFAWRANPALVPLLSRQGGHLGFHGRDSATPWHLRAAIAFLGEAVPRARSGDRETTESAVPLASRAMSARYAAS
jgi:predicted alpha/beta-fold hydrolase